MKYGLIGEKLSHSFSKQIHHQLFDYSYELKELAPTDVVSFLKAKDFVAVNVTIPYKETVLPYLDEIDESAAQIGAVNTIVNINGKLHGYNTDYDGLCALIFHSGIALEDKKVLILGSGGTSKTAMAVAHKLGCRSVQRVSRSARDGCISYEQAIGDFTDAQVLINTTPCGTFPNVGECAVDISQFPHVEGVIDVVYNPLRTRLVCEALQRGTSAVGGLYMLVAQAVRASELFVGQSVPCERLQSIYDTLCFEKENIVLVGMPGCGKSTIGKRLAQMMDRPYVDTDDLIVEKMGCSIPEAFRRVGEQGFREIETEVIQSVSSMQGVIIATGGGAILRPENAIFLRGNGRIYFLDRSLSLLSPTEDRPLSATFAALETLYEKRYPMYCRVCDEKVSADATIEDVANTIREDFLNEHFGH